MVPSLHPQTVKIIQAVKTSAELSKIASEQAMLAKVAIDAGIFGMANFSVKTASVADPVQDTANKIAELAVSVYGFNKLSSIYNDHTDRKMREFIMQIRKEAGQDKSDEPFHIATSSLSAHYTTKTDQLDYHFPGEKHHRKVGSDVTMNPILEDAISKMATVGAIEGMLNQLPSNVSEETQKLAMEIRALNRGYGVTILNDLLS